MTRLPFFVFIALIALPLVASAQNEFVPLTSIPAFQQVGDASSIAGFLNSLYMIAIGAAAVLAVLQITRAGFEYMGGDSITEKRHARHLILMSLLGLLLVLSPTIVFGIIDPRILSLEVNTSGLKPSAATNSTTNNGSTPEALPNCVIDGRTYTPISAGQVVSSEAEKACCTNQEYHVIQTGPQNFVCQANPATQNPRLQSGASGQFVTAGTTFNFYNIPARNGDFALVLTKQDTSRTPTCLALAYRMYSDSASCTAARVPAQASHQGWGTAVNCTQTLKDFVEISTQLPICQNKEELPAP